MIDFVLKDQILTFEVIEDFKDKTVDRTYAGAIVTKYQLFLEGSNSGIDILSKKFFQTPSLKVVVLKKNEIEDIGYTDDPKNIVHQLERYFPKDKIFFQQLLGLSIPDK